MKAIQDVEAAVHRCEEEQMEKEHEHMELQKRLTTLENVGEEEALEIRSTCATRRTWTRWARL